MELCSGMQVTEQGCDGMASTWMTYAWDDNDDLQIDYIRQELQASGLTVKGDRWNVTAGKPLWEQIEAFITDPNASDSWLIVATQNSLGSSPCREEFEIAFCRALENRGRGFPVLALFPGPVDTSLLPARLKLRLNVSMTDSDWIERILAAAEGRDAAIASVQIDPYFFSVRSWDQGGCVVEVRPRAGSWSPVFAAVPIDERHAANPSIMTAAGGITQGFPAGILTGAGNCVSEDGDWWMVYAANQATPIQSLYILCKNRPSKVGFGVFNGSGYWRPL